MDPEGNVAGAPVAGKTSIYNGDVTWCFFISSLVWVPFVGYLWSHWWDHRNKNHYPHTYIVGFLAFGATLRCIWYYFTSSLGHTVGWEVVNRIAILCQFTAMTLLLLMWSKALKIGGQNTPRNLDNVVQNESREAISNNSNSIGNNELANVLEAAKKRTAESNAVMKYRTHVAICVNVFAWCMVLISIILEETSNGKFKDIWYDINDSSIALLSFLVNVGIIYLGVKNYYRISRELAPQYATSSLSSSWSSSTNQEQSIFKCICSYCCANNILFSTQESLRAHTRVLRTIFKVTFIVGIFFTVRVVVLLLRTLYFDGSEDPQDFPYLSYPLLFYQFPEFFPNILVVRGIAVSSYWSSLRATNANSDKLHVQIFQCLSMCYMGLICCDCCTESPEVSSHRNQDNAVNDMEEASFNSRTAGNNYSLAHIMGLGHEWDTEEGHVNPILSYTAKKNGNTSNAIPASSTNFHQEDTRSDGSACNASSVGSERLVHDPAFGRTSTMIYEEGTFGYRGGYRQSTLHGEEQYWEPQQTNPSHTQEQNVRSSFQLE